MEPELRLKQLATAVCLRLPEDIYERTRHLLKQQAAMDAGLVAFTSKLEAAGIAYELLSSSGLLIIRADLERARAVLAPPQDVAP